MMGGHGLKNKRHKRVMISLPDGLYDKIINYCNKNEMYVSRFCSDILKDTLMDIQFDYLEWRSDGVLKTIYNRNDI